MAVWNTQSYIKIKTTLRQDYTRHKRQISALCLNKKGNYKTDNLWVNKPGWGMHLHVTWVGNCIWIQKKKIISEQLWHSICTYYKRVTKNNNYSIHWKIILKKWNDWNNTIQTLGWFIVQERRGLTAVANFRTSL